MRYEIQPNFDHDRYHAYYRPVGQCLEEAACGPTQNACLASLRARIAAGALPPGEIVFPDGAVRPA